jgi:hypothetical protein
MKIMLCHHHTPTTPLTATSMTVHRQVMSCVPKRRVHSSVIVSSRPVHRMHLLMPLSRTPCSPNRRHRSYSTHTTYTGPTSPPPQYSMDAPSSSQPPLHKQISTVSALPEPWSCSGPRYRCIHPPGRMHTQPAACPLLRLVTTTALRRPTVPTSTRARPAVLVNERTTPIHLGSEIDQACRLWW